VEFEVYRKSADEKFLMMVEEKDRRMKGVQEHHQNEIKEKERRMDDLIA
jgi:hypothetical protein